MPDPEKFFWILSKKKMQTKEDFKGVRIAGSPPFFAFFKGLDMVPQTIKDLKDYFTLMERGVVEAHIASLGVFLAVGTYELAPYIIDEPFFNSTQVLLMNLEKWNSLPKHLQKLIQEIMLETETTVPPAQADYVGTDREKLKKGGIEFYKLAPDVAKWFASTSIEAPWKEAEERYPAELVQEYRKFLRR
jgi:TRAP-type C4-dicarboxylate transport system substrate-binding protein